METLADKLEPILLEIQGTLLDRTIAQQPHMHYSDDAFSAATYIFVDVLMSRMWELQEKERIPMQERYNMVEYAGSELNKLIKEMTGVDMKDIS